MRLKSRQEWVNDYQNHILSKLLLFIPYCHLRVEEKLEEGYWLYPSSKCHNFEESLYSEFYSHSGSFNWLNLACWDIGCYP